MIFEKAPGHDWRVRYRFDDDEADEMLVFGQMTAEAALSEARFSLNGIGNMNEGQYEIISVERAA